MLFRFLNRGGYDVARNLNTSLFCFLPVYIILEILWANKYLTLGVEVKCIALEETFGSAASEHDAGAVQSGIVPP